MQTKRSQTKSFSCSKELKRKNLNPASSHDQIAELAKKENNKNMKKNQE